MIGLCPLSKDFCQIYAGFVMTTSQLKISKRIRVIIVDDHPFFRDGLSAALQTASDIDIIGEYDDGARGLKAIRQNKPDLVLLDVNLPTMNGVEILRTLRNENLDTLVIVLTAHHDKEQTLHIIRTGAQAYAEKSIQPDLLIKLVRYVAKGMYVINEKAMTESQKNAWVESQLENLTGPYTIDNEEHYIPLSPREMQILKQVTAGLSNKEIANELSISQQTVKNHMTSILRKLNVEDRTQAAITAIRRGWVRIEN